jgi:hypothetical protein
MGRHHRPRHTNSAMAILPAHLCDCGLAHASKALLPSGMGQGFWQVDDVALLH